MRRLRIICGTYFLCGLMDCMVGSLRGLGYSVLPMIVSLTGACGFRVFWIFTIFASCRTLEVLYLSYPVSWIITASAHMLHIIKYEKDSRKKMQCKILSGGLFLLRDTYGENLIEYSDKYVLNTK